MARVLHKHRRATTAWLLRLPACYSLLLAGMLTIWYATIPWFHSGLSRYFLLAVGLTGIAGALIWHRMSADLVKRQDILSAGKAGEIHVAKLLSSLPRQWVVLNDIALRVNGPIFQIDHVAIGPGGLWVLETKAQKGDIIPSTRQQPWRVRRSGRIRKIPNPVEQNKRQVAACRELLAEAEIDLPCHGAVIMTESWARVNYPLVNVTQLPGWLEKQNLPLKTVLDYNNALRLGRMLLNHEVEGKPPWQRQHRDGRLFVLTLLLPLALHTLILIL